nr:MAG TPA: hypothetical protein [Caudoviricetes sp.]
MRFTFEVLFCDICVKSIYLSFKRFLYLCHMNYRLTHFLLAIVKSGTFSHVSRGGSPPLIAHLLPIR